MLGVSSTEVFIVPAAAATAAATLIEDPGPAAPSSTQATAALQEGRSSDQRVNPNECSAISSVVLQEYSAEIPQALD